MIKKLLKSLYKVFLLIRERFFLIADTEEPSPQPSPVMGEGVGSIPHVSDEEHVQGQLWTGSFEGKMEEKEETAEDRESFTVPPLLENQHISLCETLDRVLNTGVMIYGDITISVANIDLIYIGLKAILTSVETARRVQSDSTTNTFCN